MGLALGVLIATAGAIHVRVRGHPFWPRQQCLFAVLEIVWSANLFLATFAVLDIGHLEMAARGNLVLNPVLFGVASLLGAWWRGGKTRETADRALVFPRLSSQFWRPSLFPLTRLLMRC